jgi:hypothetical protein
MDKRTNRRVPLALRRKVSEKTCDAKGSNSVNENKDVNVNKYVEGVKGVSRHSVLKISDEKLFRGAEMEKKNKKERNKKRRQAEDRANMGGIITNEDLIDELDDIDFKDKLNFIRSQPNYKDFVYNYKDEVYKKYNEILRIEYFYKNYETEESEDEFIDSEEEHEDDFDDDDDDDDEDAT